jgi:outer membrane immunogenic protein
MKKVLGALVAASMVAGHAVAADVSAQDPVYRAPPPLPAFNWTGFFVGGTLGGERAESNYSETPTGAFIHANPRSVAAMVAAGTGTLSPSGVIGDGEAGFNWQNGLFVLGAETDVSGWNLSESAAVTVPGIARGRMITATTSTSSNWLFTARVRTGIASSNWLFFVTGGLALSNVNFAQSIFFSVSQSTQAGAASATEAGWTVGGGIEYALSRNWSLKGEYLYVGFPNQTANQFNPGFPAYAKRVSIRSYRSPVRLGRLPSIAGRYATLPVASRYLDRYRLLDEFFQRYFAVAKSRDFRQRPSSCRSSIFQPDAEVHCRYSP